MAGFAAKTVFLVLAFVAVVAALPSSDDPPMCQGVSCPTSYMPGNFLTANPNDPCSYCQCVWGRPVVQPCAKHLGWSTLYSQCIPSPEC